MDRHTMKESDDVIMVHRAVLVEVAHERAQRELRCGGMHQRGADNAFAERELRSVLELQHATTAATRNERCNVQQTLQHATNAATCKAFAERELRSPGRFTAVAAR